MRSRYRWSETDLLALAEMICEGQTDAEIGRVLGCTAQAVKVVRKRNRIPPRGKALLTARGVARRLGIPCEKTVVRWIKVGYLRARKGQRCGLNRMWYVREEALFDFLGDARWWYLWEVERLQPDLRSWAVNMRDGVQFLTTGQVATLLHVQPGTVNGWIHKGYLPAVRRGNWLVRQEDLVGFVLPCDRLRVGCGCPPHGR